MADFAAPSFSLGIDFDPPDLPTNGGAEEQGIDVERDRIPSVFVAVAVAGGEADRSFGSRDTDHDNASELHSPVFKRLRRGPPSRAARPAASLSADPSPSAREIYRRDGSPSPFDDEIEEFSSQEGSQMCQDEFTIESHNSCGSSKPSLRFNGVLTRQSVSKANDPKAVSLSSAVESSSREKLFPRLTTSPIRKIYLLDSDSNDSSSDIDVDLSENTPFHSTTKSDKEAGNLQTETLWKDFNIKQKVNLTTPALDKFCEEYFRTVEEPKVGPHKEDGFTAGSSRRVGPYDAVRDDENQFFVCDGVAPNYNGSTAHPRTPSHRYFCHHDTRIRKLVQERLPYFVPLDMVDHYDGGNQQRGTASLDYMFQFGSKDMPTKARGSYDDGHEGSTFQRKGKQTKVSPMETSTASEGWLTPRNNVTILKDARQRRVRANENQSGHWFTSPQGRKVYVTKTGQELTGQMAYRNYRKETNKNVKKKKTIKKKKGAASKKVGTKR